MLVLISLVSIVKCLQNATTPAILIMNSWDNNVPVIADYNGNVRYPTIKVKGLCGI